MNTWILAVVVAAALVPTFIELRRDGYHRLGTRDDWRGLGSRHPL